MSTLASRKRASLCWAERAQYQHLGLIPNLEQLFLFRDQLFARVFGRFSFFLFFLQTFGPLSSELSEDTADKSCNLRPSDPVTDLTEA